MIAALSRLSAQTNSQILYLHANGADGLLDTNFPSATNHQTASSGAVDRTNFVEVGTWAAAPATVGFNLIGATPLQAWIGRRFADPNGNSDNSENTGTFFDLRVELLKGGTGLPESAGFVTYLRNVKADPDKANPFTIGFGSFSNVVFSRGDVLGLRVLAKVSDMSGHPTAPGASLFYDSIERPAQFGISFTPRPGAELLIATNATTSPTITASGFFPDAVIIEIIGGASLLRIDTTNGQFEASIPLQPNKINRLFFTGIAADGTRSAPLSAAVIQDAQPPSLFIDFPASGTEITTDTVDVAGRVGDMLTGFMGLNVTVNGQSANVIVGIGNNGTFEKTAVPLAMGTNVITATATDQLGNTVSRQVTVNRVAIPPDAHRILVISGNAQTARIGTVLPSPVVVQVVRSDGTPFMDKLVKFKVTRSDGRLGAAPTNTTDMEFIARTDANGYAQIYWRLGGTAGCGINRLEVTSKDIIGSAFFCASATPGAAAQINIGSGNSQRAETGSIAPEPLRAWVSDACNGVEGIPVTFTVIQGGGKVFPSPGGEGQGEGGSSLTLPTTRTGHAEVNYELGADGGNQIIEANFAGNSNRPATFVIYGVVRDTNQPTAFSGLALDNASRPIGGAHCVLQVGGTNIETHTDAQGQFDFSNIPAGPAHLHVDGLTATNLAGQTIPQGSYPALSYSLVLVPNANNSLPMPVLLPKLNPNNARMYDGTLDVELTCEGMAGLKMIVKAGSMRNPDGSIPTPQRPAILALNQVHHDDVPMPMPDGAAPPFAWTLQPGGSTFDPPIQIEYPNMSGLPAGGIAYFLSFNHDTERFEIVASGHVIDDSTTIVTDPGGGLSLAGWGCNCPPYSVTADCENCNVSINSPPPAEVCKDKAITIGASGQPAGGTYSWSGSEGISGSGSSISVTFNSTGSKTISVTYTCQTDSGPIASSDSVTVQVLEEGGIGAVEYNFGAPVAVTQKIADALSRLRIGQFEASGSVGFSGQREVICCEMDGRSAKRTVGAVNLQAGVSLRGMVPIPGLSLPAPPPFNVGLNAFIEGGVSVGVTGTFGYNDCLKSWEGSASGTIVGTLSGGVSIDILGYVVIDGGLQSGLNGTVQLVSTSQGLTSTGNVGHNGLVVFITATYTNPLTGEMDSISASYVLIQPGNIGMFSSIIATSL